MAMRVTLKDVAEANGVSFSLVSKVLRNKGIEKIPAETVNQIRESAVAMGYIANKNAQSLKSGKTMTVAVVLPVGTSFATTIFPILTEAIVQAESTDECKYDFIFFNTLGGFKEYENLQEIIALNPDGIIYSVPPKSPLGLSRDIMRQRLLKDLAESGKPILFLMEKYDIPQTCTYTFDEIAGAYVGTKYLIDAGCKRILFCRSPFDERMAGYIRAMTDSSLSYSGLITEKIWNFTTQEGYHFFQELYRTCDLSELPEAIFATCDTFALGVLKAMKEKGLSQNDIEIMGYDGLELLDICGYDLPSVIQPVRQIGKECTEAILNWIETGVKPENKVYQPLIRTRKDPKA